MRGEFVFSKLSATTFVLAALAAPIAAAASGPAQRSDSSREQRAAPPAPRADRQAPVELICRSVSIAGEAEAAPMVCMTAADWRRAEQ